MAPLRSAFAGLIICMACVAIAQGSRLMKEEDASAASTSDSRELWVNPDIKPASKVGWNVIISIVYQGHYTTVNTFKLRAGIAALGFNTDPSKLAFGGQNAMANYRCLTSFTMNFPSANSATDALEAVKGLTVQALTPKANLGKKYEILNIFFSAYKA